MGDAVKERPIAAELCALERSITSLEEAVNALKVKASMYLNESSPKDKSVEPRDEFCATAFILDTLRLLTCRVGWLRDEVNDMYNRLV